MDAFELVAPKFREALEFLVNGGSPAELAAQLDLSLRSFEAEQAVP